MTVGMTVCRSRWREGHTHPSSTVTDPGTGISPLPGSWWRSRRHRSSRPARNSNSVEENTDSPPLHLEQYERVETVARLLQLERVMAADVVYRLKRECAPSSVTEVHEDLLSRVFQEPDYSVQPTLKPCVLQQ